MAKLATVAQTSALEAEELFCVLNHHSSKGQLVPNVLLSTQSFCTVNSGTREQPLLVSAGAKRGPHAFNLSWI